jgi:hypothetical protein
MGGGPRARSRWDPFAVPGIGPTRTRRAGTQEPVNPANLSLCCQDPPRNLLAAMGFTETLQVVDPAEEIQPAAKNEYAWDDKMLQVTDLTANEKRVCVVMYICKLLNYIYIYINLNVVCCHREFLALTRTQCHCIITPHGKTPALPKTVNSVSRTSPRQQRVRSHVSFAA